jgi:ABC-type uncharacterized transport system permease subunit
MGPEAGRLSLVRTAAAALLLTLGLAAGFLWLGGFNPLSAGAAMLQGAFGSSSAILSITLVRAVPLILTGLAVTLAFRAGVWNIGAEGQLYVGAVAAVWVGVVGAELPGFVLVPLVLASACVAGALWSAIPALMRVRLGIGEVITTILMNSVGIYLAAFMVVGPLQESRGVFNQTEAIAEAARLPLLVEGTRLHIGFLLALSLGVVIWATLRWTRIGFEIRAVGTAPNAARIAGMISPNRVVLISFLTSGAIAGLAGGIEVTGVTFVLYEGLSPNWGYTAIAVALLGGLHPIAVIGTGVLFGALEGGAAEMQRTAGIPSSWVIAVEALVILSVLAVDQIRRRSRA